MQDYNVNVKRTSSYNSILDLNSQFRKQADGIVLPRIPSQTAITPPAAGANSHLKKGRTRALSGPALLYPPDNSPTTLTKTPTYEYYGFVMYLGSFVAFAIYLLWAYMPDEFLEMIGISYYPNRWWALAIPVWIGMLVPFILIWFMTINMINTPSLDSIHAITDEYSHIPNEVHHAISQDDDHIPEIQDLPMGFVNAVLYGEGTISTS